MKRPNSTDNPLTEERATLHRFRTIQAATGQWANPIVQPGSRLANQMANLQRQTNMGNPGEPPYFGRLDFMDEESCRQTVYLGNAHVDTNIFLIDFRRPIAQLYFKPDLKQLNLPGATLISCGRREILFEAVTIEKVLDGIDRDTPLLFQDEAPLRAEPAPTPAKPPAVSPVKPPTDVALKAPPSAAPTPVPATPDIDFDTSDSVRRFFVDRLRKRTAGQRFLPFVESLQPDQYDLIAHVSDNRVLVIGGPAGSGKTGCALMRAAMLHYRRRNPGEFGGGTAVPSDPLQVMLLSKTDDLLAYVDGVLPALGEAEPYRLTLRTLTEKLTKFAKKHGATLRDDEPEPSAIPTMRGAEIRHAAHAAASERKSALDGLAAAFPAGHLVAGYLDRDKQVLRNEDGNFSNPNTDVYHTEAQETAQREAEAKRVAQAAIEAARRAGRPTDAIDPNPKIYLHPTSLVDTRNWFQPIVESEKPRREFEKMMKAVPLSEIGQVDAYRVRLALEAWFVALQEYTREFRDRPPAHWVRIAARKASVPARRTACLTLARILDTGLDPRNPLSVTAWYAFASARTHLRLKVIADVNHLIVDEAQEFSPEEYALIDVVFHHKCQMSICGDLRQRQSGEGISQWRQLERAFTGGLDIRELSTNYRSTREINQVARALMPSSDSKGSPLQGSPPVIHRIEVLNRNQATNYIGGLLKDIEATPNRKIAVIWTSETPPFVPGNLGRLTSIALAKGQRSDERVIGGHVRELGGLEYDVAVLVVDTLEDSRESRRQLYVAVTRARSELHIVCCMGTPEWLPQSMPRGVLVRRPALPAPPQKPATPSQNVLTALLKKVMRSR